MSAKNETLRKVKICPIEQAIVKAKSGLTQRDKGFKKPFPVTVKSKSTTELQVKNPDNIQRKTLVAKRQSCQKENIRPEKLRKSQTKAILDIANFYSRIPIKILSPVRKTPKMVINPVAMSQYKNRLVDYELKCMIENFAKSIENLANGSQIYTEMRFAEFTDNEEPKHKKLKTN